MSDNSNSIEFSLSDDERKSLSEYVEAVDGKTNLDGESDSGEAAGLRRKRYQITCHVKNREGNEVSWVEKTYSSAIAHAIGAAGCQAKVGDPSHSLRKL